MLGRMTFSHDAVHDVVTATFQSCILESVEDAHAWRAEVEQELARFGRKVDLLIDLSGLVVRFQAGRAFGKERSEVLSRYTQRSYRFGGDETTRLFISTSGMITGAATNVYQTREQALQALLAARAGKPHP